MIPKPVIQQKSHKDWDRVDKIFREAESELTALLIQAKKIAEEFNKKIKDI